MVSLRPAPCLALSSSGELRAIAKKFPHHFGRVTKTFGAADIINGLSHFRHLPSGKLDVGALCIILEIFDPLGSRDSKEV